jgi:hypothetical protein
MVPVVGSGSRFCIGALDTNLAAVAVKILSRLIYHVKKFYKFCTFCSIFKDNAALNCITGQNTHKRFFPVNTGRVFLASAYRHTVD